MFNNKYVRLLAAFAVILFTACGDGRLSPQGGTITGATTNGGLVVTSGRLGLITSCAQDEVLVWDDAGSVWECGAGGETYTAGDGLLLTGSDFDVVTGTGITITGDAVTLNMTAASCSAGSFVSAITATGGTTCTASSYSTLSGAFTTNDVIPKGNGTGLTASSLSDDGAGSVAQAQVAGYAAFTVGDSIALTGATDNGVEIAASSDGQVYISSKVGNGDSIIHRVGHNTENGAARTWLTVTGSTGDAAFGATGSFTGLLTATAGGTTPANWTTTGTGDLVSADDLTVTDDATISGGVTTLNNGTSNIIDWGQNGVAAPTFTTRSAGTKVVLYNNVTGATVDFALGIEGGTLWSAVGDNTNGFKWYAGTTSIATLSGSGVLNVAGSFTENGSAVLSGSITDNVIPMGTATGNLEDSALADDGTYIHTARRGWFSKDTNSFLQVGYTNTNTTDGQNNITLLTDGGDGHVYFETKAASTKGLLFTIGQGAEPAYTRTWLAVTGSNGNATFGALVATPGNITATGTGFVSGAGGVYTNASATIGMNESGGSLRFRTNTTDGQMVIESDGDVTMTSDLALNDNLTAGNTVADSHTFLGATAFYEAIGTAFGTGTASVIAVDTMSMAQGVGGSIRFDGNYTGTTGTTAAEIKAFKTNGTDGNYSFDLGICTRLNGGNCVEHVRIKDSGQTNVITGSSGAGASVSGWVFAAEASGDMNISLRGPTNNYKAIFFDNPTGAADGGILYDANAAGFARGMEFRTGGNVTRHAITSGGAIRMGDATGTSVDSNLDVLTIGNTGTGQTTSGLALTQLDHTGTFTNTGDSLGITRTVYGSNVEMTTQLTGSCTNVLETNVCMNLNVVGIRGHAAGDFEDGPSGQVTNFGGDFSTGGDARFNYAVRAIAVGPEGGDCGGNPCETTAGPGVAYGIWASAPTGDIRYSGYFDYGTLYISANGFLQVDSQAEFNDDVTFNDPVAFVDSVTFSNGPAGINTYAGTHFEWSDEWMQRLIVASAPAGTIYYVASSGGAITADHGGAGRPGVVQISTSTSSSASLAVTTSYAAYDFDGSTTMTYEWVGGFPTLSTSGEEYSATIGFFDATAIDFTDGCAFLYDRGATQATPGTGDSDVTGDRWKIISAENGTRTGYDLDGTATEDSFTGVNSPVAALTWPSTNVYKLKIVAENDDKCRFFINDVEVGRITSNVPGGTTRLTGAGWVLRKSAGTTARTMDTDFTKLAFDLSAARTP